MTDITERFSREEIDTPVTDRFPELSGFKTIDEGFAGLFRALKQGAALPALALAPLIKLLAQQEEPVE